MNPALDTKVQAMKRFLLTPKQYQELIALDNVKQIFLYLKDNTDYKKDLEDLNVETVSRIDIEAALNKRLIQETEKILYYILGDEKSFIRLILLRVNLESFLILLRALLKGEDLEKVVSHLAFSSKFDNFVKTQNFENSNWNLFKESLRNTIFYRSIETYQDVSMDDLFEIEKTLERAYYDQKVQRMKKLNPKKQKALITLLRKEIDMRNLIWLYRAKKFYHFKVDQILPYIYIGGLYLDNQTLYDLAITENIDTFLNKVSQFKDYQFLFSPENFNEMQLDIRFRRYMHEQMKELFFFHKGITKAYAFLHLLMDEISEITSIIEAKRYKLDESELDKYLLEPIKENVY